MRNGWFRWMARRRLSAGRMREALHWYGKLGEADMTDADRIGCASALHELGETEEALRMLSELLARTDHPQAYERRARIRHELGREAEAIADLDEAIRLAPSSATLWYARAVAHNDLGKLDLAARDFREALRLEPERTRQSTWYELGQVYVRQGEYSQAEEAFARSVSRPERAIPHGYYRRSQVLVALGRIEEALEELRRGIALLDRWRSLPDGGLAELRARTGYSPAAARSQLRHAEEEYGFRLLETQMLEKLRRPAEALAAVRRALERYPRAVPLRLREAALLRGAGRTDEAVAALTRLRDDAPDVAAAHLELCATYRAAEQWDEAVAALEEAHARFPDHRVAHYWLADALKNAGRLAEARACSAELTAVEPEDPVNWRQRAELAIEAGDYADAENAYDEAIRREPSAESYLRRSYVRFMADRYEASMADLQEAARLDEKLRQDSKTAYAMGELYVAMGNPDLAELAYSQAIGLEPDNPLLYDRRARCRLSQEKLREALADCRKGLSLDPDHARLIWLRGFIHFRLQEYDAALADSLRYEQLMPDDPQGCLNLGLVYARLRRYDEAESAFTRTLRLNPFEAQAYLERAAIQYHQRFDRNGAADDLAQWLLYAGGEKPEHDRFAMLEELDGFDDEMRERAKERFLAAYGSSRYLS